MGRALSQDLRDGVIAAVDGGMSRNAAAARLGVAVATAVCWVRAWRKEELPTPRPKGCDLRSRRIEGYLEVILAAIDEQVDFTLVELSALLRGRHNTWCAPSATWRFLDPPRDDLQKRSAHASEQERPDVAVCRRVWSDAQPDVDQARLVFINA